MNSIIFFTGNRTKLAHISYLGENENIGIKYFHELTYRASYDEPRINDRDSLLRESVESALEQLTWNKENETLNQLIGEENEKTVLKNRNSFFLIEDTSVIIHALSTREKEVPGLDIKYWMEEMTFEKLDSLLSQFENRDVTVRSDMVLFNTSNTIKKYFCGRTKGTIVKEEIAIETNLLYPWLDGNSFNKWFIPEGHRVPISKLPITEADKVDFRRKAFAKVSNYLKKNFNYFTKEERASRKQYPLFNVNRNVLVVIGYSCAGKTTMAQYLTDKYNILHIEASDFMRINFYERHGVKNIHLLDKFASQALNEKPHIVARKIVAEMVEETGFSDIVITGFRSSEEFRYITENLKHSCEFKLFLVEASIENRAKRAIKRNRENDVKSIGEMKEKDDMQNSMGMEGFSKNDLIHKIIDNDGTMNNLFQRIDSFLQKEDMKLNPFQKMPKEGKLKNSIMNFLFDHYESGECFTTTEISAGLEGHHKDNISRFFNQRFYPEFDIITDSGKKKFKLSNTGYSKTLLIRKMMRNPG